jgi:hypothetical protein
MNKIVVITTEELKDLIQEAINKALDAREPKNERTYTINQVAKMLNRSHRTIKSLTEAGVFKTTPDGKIFQSSIDHYLTQS